MKQRLCRGLLSCWHTLRSCSVPANLEAELVLRAPPPESPVYSEGSLPVTDIPEASWWMGQNTSCPLRTNNSPKRVNLFPELLLTNSSAGICLSLFFLWFLFHSCLVDTDLIHPFCSQNSSHTCTFWSQEIVACSPRRFSLEGAFNPRLIELEKASSLGAGGGGVHFSSERSETFPLNNYNCLTVKTVPLGLVPGNWTTLQWTAP